MFGSHLSIAGGLHNALLEAERLGCESAQIFTKNQQQWKASPLVDATILSWKEHAKRLKFKLTVSHDSYLINLAAADDVLWNKSVDLFVEELTRCDLLGIPYLVAHPGAHVGSGDEAGIKRIIQAIDLVHERLPEAKVMTCLESTAGQGSSIGHRLEHLAEIIDGAKQSKRLGVCLDTAHLFAAGYDFRGKKFDEFRKELDKVVGVKRVKVWHLNDSKKDLGSRVDRHDHIGVGKIGLEGFRGIVNDDAFKKVPKILETAKDKHPDGRDWDAVNLEVLRGLIR